VSKTALQNAFELSREHHNIDLVLDALLAAELYVIAAQFPGDPEPQFVLRLSPSPNRNCVTALESPGLVSLAPDLILMKMTGRELLDRLQPKQELVIAYKSGGAEYLGHEQVDWLRELRKVRESA
jgi:hypothetical protein